MLYPEQIIYKRYHCHVKREETVGRSLPPSLALFDQLLLHLQLLALGQKLWTHVHQLQMRICLLVHHRFFSFWAGLGQSHLGRHLPEVTYLNDDDDDDGDGDGDDDDDDDGGGGGGDDDDDGNGDSGDVMTMVMVMMMMMMMMVMVMVMVMVVVVVVVTMMMMMMMMMVVM